MGLSFEFSRILIVRASDARAEDCEIQNGVRRADRKLAELAPQMLQQANICAFSANARERTRRSGSQVKDTETDR